MGYLLAFELHNEPVFTGYDSGHEAKVFQKMASYMGIPAGEWSDDSGDFMVAATVKGIWRTL